MPIAHTEGHIDCPACELNRIEAIAQPATTAKIAGGTAMGILIAIGVLAIGGGLVYFVVHYILWQ